MVTKKFDDLVHQLNSETIKDIEQAKRDLLLAKSFSEQVHNKVPFLPSLEFYEKNLTKCEHAI